MKTLRIVHDPRFKTLTPDEQFNRLVVGFMADILESQSLIDSGAVEKFFQYTMMGELEKARKDYLEYKDLDQTINCFLLDMLG